jgi:hypothetical protein
MKPLPSVFLVVLLGFLFTAELFGQRIGIVDDNNPVVHNLAWNGSPTGVQVAYIPLAINKSPNNTTTSITFEFYIKNNLDHDVDLEIIGKYLGFIFNTQDDNGVLKTIMEPDYNAVLSGSLFRYKLPAGKIIRFTTYLSPMIVETNPGRTFGTIEYFDDKENKMYDIESKPIVIPANLPIVLKTPSAAPAPPKTS